MLQQNDWSNANGFGLLTYFGFDDKSINSFILGRVSEDSSRIVRINESCGYYSAPVSFESSEYAKCKGVKAPGQYHRNPRAETLCSVYAACFYGSAAVVLQFAVGDGAANLPPEPFFAMSGSPFDVNYESGMFALQEQFKPLCLFLMQRHLPKLCSLLPQSNICRYCLVHSPGLSQS